MREGRVVECNPTPSRMALTRLCPTLIMPYVIWIALAMSAQQTALAQDVQPTKAGPSIEQGIEEVVVTAEKRESTVGKTPIAITAVSGEQLLSQGIADLASLSFEVPGMSMQNYGPGQTEFVMRGLSSSGGESPTVGFYVDEISLSPPATAQNGKVAIDPDLYDVSRVEVLRGPQGTLYGAGSMGGTIKLVTNQPNLEDYAASAQAVLSGTDGGGFNYSTNVMVNIPLVTGQLAVRVVGTDTWRSGWIDRIVLADFPLETNPACQAQGFFGCTRGNVSNAAVAESFKDSNWEHLEGGRVEVLYQPVERLSISTTAMYQIINMGAPDFIDYPPGTETHYQPFNVAEPFQDMFSLASGSVNYRFDAFTVTSATGYWYREQSTWQDASEILQSAFGTPYFSTSAPFPGGMGAAAIPEMDTEKQFSQELRIASNDEHPFRWIAGLYYNNYDSVSADGSGFIVPGLTTFAGGIFASTDGDFVKIYRPTRIVQQAVFGEGSYDLTDKLTATIGLRYFEYSSKILTTESGFISPTGGPTPITFPIGTGSSTGTNPKFNLAYQMDDDTLFYATASKGFRPGGANIPVPTTGPDSCATSLAQFGLTQAPLEYQPDSLWSYELGEKTKLFGDRVTLNSDVYYENWSGVQQHVVLGCGFHFEANAGDAAVYGAEAELKADLGDGLSLSQSGSYTYASLTENVPEIGWLKGQQLLDVPNWVEATAIDYIRQISANWAFVARLDNEYTGPSLDEGYSIQRLPGYDFVNFRAGVTGEAWVAELFVNNLGKAQARMADTISYSENIPSLDRVVTNQPRTIGVDLQYKF